MNKLIFLFIGILQLNFAASAQNLSGRVVEQMDDHHMPLIGASVYWLGTTVGTSTDADGKFTIEQVEDQKILVVSFIGFSSDTLKIGEENDINIVLKASQQLGDVTVEKRVQSTFHSLLDPLNMQKITSAELLKAACCNLSESFETNASVDVSYADAVSGAKQIRMLGLEGIYSQILTENLPGIRGLSTSYGLSTIPGPWMESIQVSKGAASVLNGYESITGQINVEYVKPEKQAPLFVNAYVNSRQKLELNVITAAKLSKKWSTMLMAHGETVQNRVDNNGDGFLDFPLQDQLNFFHRWKYKSDGKFRLQFGVKALTERRVGGEANFSKNLPPKYNIGIDVNRLETFTKTGWIYPETPWRSVGILTSASYYDQKVYFGNRTYSGKERSLYLNFIYATMLFNTTHKIKSGFSYVLDDFNEVYQDSSFKRTESVPGVFTEYTWAPTERFTLVPGLRADLHEEEDVVVIPRLHTRLQLSRQTILRASAGRGYRSPNVIAENMRYFASSRSFVFSNKLLPEIAWNYGLSLNQTFEIADREGSIHVDVYRTDFQQQVVVDLDQDVHQVNIYNLKGSSYANSAQIEINYELRPRFDVKSAFKVEDVRVQHEMLPPNVEQPQGPRQKVFVPRFRGLLNLSYKTKYEKWAFNQTSLWTGPARIPNTRSNPEEFQAAGESPDFVIFNAQITRSFKHWDWYVGGENLLGFVQEDPILAAEDPFGPNFDASLVWGPLHGPMFYTGIRFTIE